MHQWLFLSGNSHKVNIMRCVLMNSTVIIQMSYHVAMNIAMVVFFLQGKQNLYQHHYNARVN